MSGPIYKYQLEPAGETMLGLPRGSRILSLQAQGDLVMMWVLLSENPEVESRRFYAVVTGTPPATDWDCYWGTVQILGGSFVTHIFERQPQPMPGTRIAYDTAGLFQTQDHGTGQ